MIEDESNKLKDDFLKEYYTRTIEYDRVLEGNLLLWTEYLDNCLKDYVIRFNFNFFEVANRFHEFISFPYKYDFSEEECRFHWSFLHSARALNLKVDNEFYDQLKKKHKDFHKKPKKTNEYTDVVEMLDEQLANESKSLVQEKPNNTIVTSQEKLNQKEIKEKERQDDDNLMKRILEMNERNRIENQERERIKEKELSITENTETQRETKNNINEDENENEKEVLFDKNRKNRYKIQWRIEYSGKNSILNKMTQTIT